MAVVPQALGLVRELSIEENVALPIRLARHASSLEVADLLARLDLTRLRHRYPHETSLGEQQRAAVARALVLGSRLVLADEPLAHQDEERAAAIVAALRASTERGGTCLIATHDASAAGPDDRVFRFRDGALEERTV